MAPQSSVTTCRWRVSTFPCQSESQAYHAVEIGRQFWCAHHTQTLAGASRRYVTPQLDHITPYFGGLFEGEPLPENGAVKLEDAPGFGLTLIREGLIRP